MYSTKNNIERTSELATAGTSFLENELAPGLTVIVLNIDKPELLKQIQSGFRQASIDSRVPMQLIIGDTGSQNSLTMKLYQDSKGNEQIVYLNEYHFARNNNVLANLADYSTILFLNNDVLIESNPDVLINAWQLHSCLKKDSIVSCKLVYPNLKIQHFGIDFFKEGANKNLPFHLKRGESLPRNGDKVDYQKFPAVTGAFLTISAHTFKRAGGFDEGFKSECQDIALCLEVAKLGGKCYVFDPGNLIHLENATRPKNEENLDDRDRFLRKYSRFVENFV
jgi:GT2 family glycosyltransferase